MMCLKCGGDMKLLVIEAHPRNDARHEAVFKCQFCDNDLRIAVPVHRDAA